MYFKALSACMLLGYETCPSGVSRSGKLQYSKKRILMDSRKHQCRTGCQNKEIKMKGGDGESGEGPRIGAQEEPEAS